MVSKLEWEKKARKMRTLMGCIIAISFWSLHKLIWTESLENYSLQRIANQLLNAFANIKKMTKSYASSLNDRSRIEDWKEQVINTLVNKSITCQKYHQTINSKDKSSRKKKEQNKEVCIYIVISTFKEVITQKQVMDIYEETTPIMN
jgi:hypothetical protein